MKLGLIGHPVAHSFSPAYFQEKFNQLGENHSYDGVDIDDIRQIHALLRDRGWDGFNVTLPHKQAIIPFLSELDDDAKAIGAVNTVVVEPDGLKGFNTDHIGFGYAIDAVLLPTDRTALILGDGGAAQAVKYALQKRSITYRVVSRSSDLTYADLHPSIIREHEIIINTTPLGMDPFINEVPDIPYEAITSQHLLVDLIYKPAETLFLKRGRLLGARTMNGDSMLCIQADESWKIWQAHHM